MGCIEQFLNIILNFVNAFNKHLCFFFNKYWQKVFFN